MAQKFSFLFSFLMFCFVISSANAAVITVNLDGSGDYVNIQAAVDAAVDGDIIEVGNGTYAGDGNKDIDFEGKLITVKSKNGPEYTQIDCQNSGRAFYFRNLETNEAVVSGFTITRANTKEGGAIRCGKYESGGEYELPGETVDTGSPTIENCIFVNNHSDYIGGAIAVNTSNPVIRNCEFTRNSASWYGGAISVGYKSEGLVISNCSFTENTGGTVSGYGGGLYLFSGAGATVRDCTFLRNQADQDGGAITLREANATIERCIVQGNTAYWGGGISAKIGSSLTLINSLITGNNGGRGGGIACRKSKATIINSTITGNYASGGNTGEIGVGGFFINEATGTIVNSIIHGNRNGDYFSEDNTVLTVSHSNIGGLSDWASYIEGSGNIDADPMFVSTTDFHLTTGSPCVDTGTDASAPSDDLESKIRPQGDGFNMGAYEEVIDSEPAGSGSGSDSSTCFIRSIGENGWSTTAALFLILVFCSGIFLKCRAR